MAKNMNYCPFCNAEIQYDAKKCRHCKKWLEDNKNENIHKEFLVALLLCYFLGTFGFHRFYTGYIGIGLAQLLTMGGFGIWSFIDLVSICLNSYKDTNGSVLYKYNKPVGIVFLVLPILATIILILLIFLMIKFMSLHGGCHVR